MPINHKPKLVVRLVKFGQVIKQVGCLHQSQIVGTRSNAQVMAMLHILSSFGGKCNIHNTNMVIKPMNILVMHVVMQIATR